MVGVIDRTWGFVDVVRLAGAFTCPIPLVYEIESLYQCDLIVANGQYVAVVAIGTGNARESVKSQGRSKGEVE